MWSIDFEIYIHRLFLKAYYAQYIWMLWWYNTECVMNKCSDEYTNFSTLSRGYSNLKFHQSISSTTEEEKNCSLCHFTMPNKYPLANQFIYQQKNSIHLKEISKNLWNVQKCWKKRKEMCKHRNLSKNIKFYE